MKVFLNNLKKLWKFTKGEKAKLILFGITNSIGVLIGIILPIFSARIIIYLTDNKFKQLIMMATIIYLIENIYNIVFYFQRYASQRIFRNVYISIQKELGREILKITNSCFDEEGSGTFLQRITGDTRRLSDIFNSLITFISSIIGNIGIYVALFLINKIVFIYVTIFSIILFFIENRRSNIINEQDKKIRKMNEKNSSFIAEMIRGARDVKMLNAEESFLQAYEDKVVTTNQFQYEMDATNRKLSLIRSVLMDTRDFTLIILLVYLISKGNLAVATALVVRSYSTRLSSIVDYFGMLLDKIKDFNLSCTRVFGILDGEEYPKEVFGNRKLDKVKGNFEFKNVSFSYDGKKKVLDNMNFKIKPNSTVAFVGKSGTGKSTIFSLLCKMYDVDNGEIKIDGVNINELDKDTIRGNITIINQNPYIFNLSIRDNLKLVKNDLTDEEMEETCKAVCIDEFIKALPDRYDTIVGEGGVNLSGGQKQRLAIARALIQKTEIILFDEATSALDNITQQRIQQAIENMKHDYTIMIIAHRLSTIVNSDRILFIEDGHIESEGTHEELLKSCKSYKKLYETEIKE